MLGVDVDIENLEVAYGSQKVLHGIDLKIDAGEFVALLGSSGCGKTTLLRCLSGFIPPSAGQIRVGGRDVVPLPPEKRNMAMVFQSYALWPHMTVRQNIGYGLKLRKRRKVEIAAKVDQLIEMLGLGGLDGRKTLQLSGGQRQRVALGRALAIDPPVLLLDEPLSNLDARIRLTMRHEIRSLQKRLGLTAVHVTHDREEAMVMADRIVILDQGRIAQIGAPAEVYERPAGAFVAAFMGAENEFELTARADGDKICLMTPDAEVVLPLSSRLGDSGVHCVRANKESDRYSARFRSGEASLTAGGRAGTDQFGLPGTIRQASYPGGCYRYAVESGGRLLMIDDPENYPEGTNVTISIPASSLHVFPACDGRLS